VAARWCAAANDTEPEPLKGIRHLRQLLGIFVLVTLLGACSADPESLIHDPDATADPGATSADPSATGGPGVTPGGPPDTGPPGTSQPGTDPPPQTIGLPSPAILVGAGRVGRCGPVSHQTAALVDDIDGIVFTLGDNAYNAGTAEQFAECYGPAWGQFRQRTRPVPGNHDYRTPGAAPYFDYFGPNTGRPGEGWHAYQAGAWRVYALNSACAQVGGCGRNSAQYRWLRGELADHRQGCAMAYWHNPLWASGFYQGSDNMLAIFELLYDAGAELVLTGHDHIYERFVPVDPRGRPDLERGIRQINVGTGSSSLDPFRGPPLEITDVRDNSTHGVMKLELRGDGYSWEFLPVNPDGFNDHGSDGCR
jgi:hypothetical protein